MSAPRDTADLDLVLAVIKPHDWLRARAMDHLAGRGRLLIPYSVGIELLFVAREAGVSSLVAALGAAESRFELEHRDVLYSAAQALDDGTLTTVFDAIHGADASDRGGRLHTTDRRLRVSGFPTETF